MSDIDPAAVTRDIEEIFERHLIYLRYGDGAIIWQSFLTREYPRIDVPRLLDITSDRLLAVGKWEGDGDIDRADVNAIVVDYIKSKTTKTA